MKELKTEITIEISAGRAGVGLPSLRWKPLFEELGIPVSIQPGELKGELETTETTIGGRRHVTLRGEMDRQGTLHFQGRSFAPGEAEKLRAWIEELRKYGAQGNPEGQPAWGLNPEQFADLFAALKPPVQEEIAGLPLDDAIGKLSLDPKYPLQYSREAETHVATRRSTAVRNSLLGFSRGTALAIVLSEYGVGFRPVRSPEGQISLEVLPLGDVELWPIGWDPQLSRPQTAPALFKLVGIELSDLPFLDVVAAISAKAEIPIVFDYHRIDAKQIDLGKIIVNFPGRQAAYNTLLRSMTLSHKLNHRIQVDEAGRPFVWISTVEVRPPQR